MCPSVEQQTMVEGNETGPPSVREGHLRSLAGRYPKGLSLSREDLALLAWLYLFEETRRAQGVLEAELRWLIESLGDLLGEGDSPMQPQPMIQRLLRYGMLRLTLFESASRGYRLTSLGRGLGRNLIESCDYSSDALALLLACALDEVHAASSRGDGALWGYLTHVFLGVIREKLEAKLLAMEEDLDRRKQGVRASYAAKSAEDFEEAIAGVEYCREALGELLDAVEQSSATRALETLFHDRLGRAAESDLQEALEQSLDFLYLMRLRIEAMLRDVVVFTQDCAAFRTLAFTIGGRERLRAIQESLLAYALEHPVRMPVLSGPALPRVELNWSRRAGERPIRLDMEGLKSLDDYRPGTLPPIEPPWKAAVLESARIAWPAHAAQGGAELSDWLTHFMAQEPDCADNPALLIWYLSQDWPKWEPSVAVEHTKGRWVPLGRSWMMEAVRLVPGSVKE